MKSNRMRLIKPAVKNPNRLEANWISPLPHGTSEVKLEEMAAPTPISQIHPDQIIEDILVSTLSRVQNSTSPAIAAAAARYISLLRAKAI